MNRRKLLTLGLGLPLAVIAAPRLGIAQAADPYAPVEVPIREGFEVGSIVVVSDDYFLYHVIAPGRAIRYGVAVGTVEEVARATRLKPYPTDLTSVADHLREITDRFRSYGERVRAAIDTTDDAGDASTADVLTEASRQADKDLWFLQSHLD